MAANALAFDVGDYVVYPKHGVGRVVELQKQEIAGMQLELYVLRFEKERMTLRVPINKAESVGMRKLSRDKTLKEAMETLKGKPKVKRTMWSRRAQEYEAKINSGDLVSIAEVTRDLFRAEDQPEQSYSERQIFEAASSRLARELAAMEQTDEPTALEKILDVLRKYAPQYYESTPKTREILSLTGHSKGRPGDRAALSLSVLVDALSPFVDTRVYICSSRLGRSIGIRGDRHEHFRNHRSLALAGERRGRRAPGMAHWWTVSYRVDRSTKSPRRAAT